MDVNRKIVSLVTQDRLKTLRLTRQKKTDAHKKKRDRKIEREKECGRDRPGLRNLKKGENYRFYDELARLWQVAKKNAAFGNAERMKFISLLACMESKSFGKLQKRMSRTGTKNA